MPIGNGAPQGLPAMPLRVLQDPRTYYRAWTAGNGSGGNTDETPIASPYAAGAIRGQLSPYARAVLSTPGLMNWWRLGKTLTQAQASPPPTSFTKAPFFANSAGAATLRTQGTGTASLVAGLIPGDPDGACKLDGSSYLDAFDYKAQCSTWEVQSVECWIKLSSLSTEFGIVAEWGNGVNSTSESGWMLYCPGSSGDLRLYSGDAILTASAALAANKLYHIVGVWGGQESSTPDYYTRIYLNGVCVANGLEAVTTFFMNPASGSYSRLNIGAYNQGLANGGFLNGVVDEVSTYNRMLQPEEVAQHYQAAFARS